MRLGADENPPGFEHFFGIGIDADLDGAIDLFLGVNNSGQADSIGLFDPVLENFDQDSPLQMVAGTSTQANALNQDLGGSDGGMTSTETWATLGAMSAELSAADLLPVPEPGTGTLTALGLVALAAAKRRS